jgi:hypothetical protein
MMTALTVSQLVLVAYFASDASLSRNLIGIVLFVINSHGVHGPSWQETGFWLHVEIAEQNLRVLLNHRFICRANAKRPLSRPFIRHL